MNAPQAQSSTVELSNVVLTLRSDLRFTLQRHGDQPCYLIEDTQNSKFFRIGIPEFTFLSLFDGTTTIGQALAYTAGRLGPDAFTEADAAGICKWLIECQLAFTSASREHDRLNERSEKAHARKKWQRINPIMIRLPLFNPDGLLQPATRWLGGWFSRPALVVWLALVGYAAFQVVTHWGTIPGKVSSVLALSNVIWLAVTWVVLKVAHEVSHGVACQRFGGHVREAGFLWILFAPIPYVDVTSSWRFASKWERIMVSAAGMYTEIFLAAIAALVWVHAEPGVVSQQAYNVVIAAGVMTVIFNANPLMRFDGYYILSDLVGIPNLYGLGQQYVSYLARRYAMGVKARSPLMPGWQGWFTRAYGLASIVWRCLVSASLMITAAVLWEGIGIALAVMAAGTWLAIPTYQLAKYLVDKTHVDRPQCGRLAVVLLTAGALIAGIAILPEPGGVRAPGVIRYAPLQLLRAPYDGFVEKMHVHGGSPVTAGMELALLRSEELPAEVHQVRLSARQAELRGRVYQMDDDLATVKVEAELHQSLTRKADEQESRWNRSTLKASAPGNVLTRQPSNLLGRFLREGEEVVAIGDESAKELFVAVSQDDFNHFSSWIGRDVEIYVWDGGSRRLTGRCQAIDPKASVELEELALSAENGGPLPVRARKEARGKTGEDIRWELVEPRFAAIITLDAEQSRSLRAGQRAVVRLSTPRGTLWQAAARGIRDWIEVRLKQP